MLSYSEAMIRGQAGSPPQLAPAAEQFGVLATWMVLDFAAGRPLRKRVKVAIPDLVMPRGRRVISEALRMTELARVKFLLESARRRARAGGAQADQADRAAGKAGPPGAGP
jgi:hypothetical protein